MSVWIFYHEDEGEKGENSFTVLANDHEQAFELAFESYGPQVNDMYYREVSESYEGLEEIKNN